MSPAWGKGRSAAERLEDILAACAVGADIVRRGWDRYLASAVEQYASDSVMLRIGESLIMLEQHYPEVAERLRGELGDETFQDWKGQRRLPAHAYHEIDYELFWVTLTDDLPQLRAAAESVKAGLDGY